MAEPEPSRTIERREITHRAQWLAWRSQDVTASDAPALFADVLHPYRSAFDLWALKSGRIAEPERETPDQRRGRDLEKIVLDMAREDRPEWEITPSFAYYRDPAARIGATPDAEARRPDIEGFGNFQIKTANDAGFRSWRTRAGEIEPPLWVAIQATVEASLSGASWAAVAVLEMAKWQVHILDVPLRPALMETLRDLVADFWERVRTGEYYPPNWARDAELIARLYAEAEDAEVDLSGDNRIVEIVTEREKLKTREADGEAAGKARKLLDAEILFKLQNHERGRLADGRVISAPTTRRKGYEVKPTTYRSITVKAS
jgi:predicted phage-related endonuclease